MNAQVITDAIRQEAKAWSTNAKSSPWICLLSGIFFLTTLAVLPLLCWFYGINAESVKGSQFYFEALVKNLRKVGIVAVVIFLAALRLGLFRQKIE